MTQRRSAGAPRQRMRPERGAHQGRTRAAEVLGTTESSRHPMRIGTWWGPWASALTQGPTCRRRRDSVTTTGGTQCTLSSPAPTRRSARGTMGPDGLDETTVGSGSRGAANRPEGAGKERAPEVRATTRSGPRQHRTEAATEEPQTRSERGNGVGSRRPRMPRNGRGQRTGAGRKRKTGAGRKPPERPTATAGRVRAASAARRSQPQITWRAD